MFSIRNGLKPVPDARQNLPSAVNKVLTNPARLAARPDSLREPLPLNA
jgi:hypothetical protein